ncbi:MAG: sodium:calcium antiporter [Ilumatobacteraceae bacterium]
MAERPLPFQLMLVLVGLTVLVVGSQLLVEAATDIATEFGVSELVIGLTVVAIGTSLPELATSMLAAFRGQREIAVGNVVGSNLFNLMSVLGITGVVASDGIPVSDAALRLDFPVMLAATIVLLPIFWNGFEIKRWEGALLITFYAGYVAYLVLDSSDHGAQQVVGPAVLIAGGLALLAFSVTGFQGWQRHRRASAARVTDRAPPPTGAPVRILYRGRPMKVLFATAELAPLVRVGGLAAAAAGLIDELRRQDVDLEVAVARLCRVTARRRRGRPARRPRLGRTGEATGSDRRGSTSR